MNKKFSRFTSFLLVFAFLFGAIMCQTVFAEVETAINSYELDDFQEIILEPESSTTDNNTEAVENQNTEPLHVDEIIHENTEFSRVFLNDDGSKTVYQYIEPIAYEDATGIYILYDNSIVDSEKQGYYKNKAGDVQVYLPDDITQNPVIVQDSTYRVEMKPVASDKGELFSRRVSARRINRTTNDFSGRPQLMGRKEKVNTDEMKSLDYSIQDGVNFEYLPIIGGFKENIVLSKKPSSNKFYYELSLNGMIPNLSAENTINLINDQKETVFQVSAPFMTDASGNYSESIQLQVSQLGNTSKYIVTLIVDNDYLSNAVYPVTIDPSTSKTTDSGGRNIRIASSLPTKNYSGSYIMCTGQGSSSGTNYSLICFANPTIPSGSTLTAAQLKVNTVNDGPSGSNASVGAQRITSSWSNSVTWNTKPSDTNSTNDTNNVGTGKNVQYSWDITGCANSWYNSGSANYGIVLKNVSGTGYREWATSVSSYTSPTLVITYATTTLTVNSATSASWSASAAASSTNITVATNVLSGWKINSVSQTPATSWFSASVVSGKLHISTTANTGTSSRTGTVKVGAGGLERTVSVTQAAPASTIKVSSITLSPKPITLNVGKTQQLAASILPANVTNSAVVWSTSSSSIVSVSSSGLVTANAVGSASITCTAQDGSGVKDTCSITVVSVPTVRVTSITLSPTTATLYLGGTTTQKQQQLSASVSPSNVSNKTVTWSSSNISVATVSSTGLVTATGVGTATISAIAQDGSGVKSNPSCTVTIRQLVTSVTLSSTSATIYLGNTKTLITTVSPSTASNKAVTWSSSNTAIATVTSSGVVTPKKTGSATIRATAQDGSGKYDSCTVTVKPATSTPRQKVVQRMLDMASVRWKPTNQHTISNDTGCSQTYYTSYIYHGIPYTRRGSTTWTLEGFIGGTYMEGKLSSITLSSSGKRNDCSAALTLALRVSGTNFPTNTMYYTGSFLNDDGTVVKSLPTGVKSYGKGASNYAKLQPGDFLVRRNSKGGHAMLVSGIDIANNKVKVIEQKQTAVHKVVSTETYYTTWYVNRWYSYSDLNSSGYNAFTLAGYLTAVTRDLDDSEYPYYEEPDDLPDLEWDDTGLVYDYGEWDPNEVYEEDLDDWYPTPMANYESGPVLIGTLVTLSTQMENAIIYYTIDGSEPTTSNSVFLLPLSITQSTVIKSIAVNLDLECSEVVTFTYTIVGTLIGDIDSDGTVAMTDAMMLFDYLSGLRLLTSSQLADADIDRDGNVTMADAMRMFDYLSGLRPDL